MKWKISMKENVFQCIIFHTNMTFHFQNISKQSFFKARKFMWHFGGPPSPSPLFLECHVLFEWPLIRFRVTTTFKTKAQDWSIFYLNIYWPNLYRTWQKPSCDIAFTHAENACVFRASWAKPRFIPSNQGKNAMLCIEFWLGIFSYLKTKAHTSISRKSVCKHALRFWTCKIKPIYLLCIEEKMIFCYCWNKFKNQGFVQNNPPNWIVFLSFGCFKYFLAVSSQQNFGLNDHK